MLRKKLLPTLCVLSLLLTACNATAPEEQSPNPELTPEEEQAAEEAWQQSVEGMAQEEAEDDQPRTIRVTAQNWEFSPSTITVKKGETVSLELVGTVGAHGFAVPGLGINISVTAGQTITIQIPTDTPGTFEFFCSIPCGSGHRDMKGTIVIEA